MTEKAGMTERVAILIVEDDNLQRRQMVRALRAEGYEILQASDGNEAIRILLDQKVDAVLTDRKMPGMNGDDLVRHIKSNLSEDWINRKKELQCPDSTNTVVFSLERL